MPTTRLRIDLAYDGTDFHGWAAQPGLRTVQGELDRALRTVLRLDDVATTCAGRTDTGVHARGQVVHADLDTGDEPPERVARRLNGVLPPDVRVRGCAVAPPGFDARFGALWRRYAYRLVDAPEAFDPLARHQSVAWSRPLDVEAMNLASEALVGEHDFAAFCKRREGATTVRRVLELRWERPGPGVVEGAVRADAFCHHMVRSLTGCLLAVGEGRRPVSWPAEVLAARVRDSAVLVVPARGLTLEEVAYPPPEQLAEQATRTRVVRSGG